MNLVRLFLDSAERSPQRPAVRLGAQTLSYADLADRSARTAGLLGSRGLQPGERVAIMVPNIPEFAVAYYGVLRAGGVVVPMNPLLKSREIAYYVDNSGARLVFAAGAAVDQARAGTDVEVIDVGPELTQALDQVVASPDVVEREPSDTAVILYTSGTTGHPKGAELTHSSLTRNAEVTQSDLLRLQPGEVVFGGLPLFHSFGQTVTLNATLSAGATTVLLPRFDAQAALDLVSSQEVAVFAGVPTMYSALTGLSEVPDLPRLRMAVSGGAALPVEVLARFEDRFGCPLLEGYGLSETSPVASFNRTGGRRKVGSIGLPVTGVQMQVVDDNGVPVAEGEVGEIAIRGHNVMKGYWNKPDETAAVMSDDGWFRTGDIGRTDSDGFFFIVDRKKDLVIRGGFNVYPREIEEVLYEHPDVAEAAVIGIPHAELGEEIGAAVVLRPGSDVAVDDLRSFVRERVAPYKYPRVVWLLDSLPKSSTGKVLKREIVPPATQS
ncbi:MAG: long-chain-fatty-acid--CoA ligase [Actinomycetales bacterium]